jgi:hypothetical protein
MVDYGQAGAAMQCMVRAKLRLPPNAAPAVPYFIQKQELLRQVWRPKTPKTL